MNKRDRLIGVLLILSVLFFQYLWLLLSVLLLVILGILIFDTRYDRYALVMVVLVLLLYLSAKFMFYETYLVPTKSMLPALNSNVTVRGEKWRYGGIYLSAVEELPLVTMFTRSSKYRTGKFAAKDRIKMIGFWKPKKMIFWRIMLPWIPPGFTSSGASVCRVMSSPWRRDVQSLTGKSERRTKR